MFCSVDMAIKYSSVTRLIGVNLWKILGTQRKRLDHWGTWGVGGKERQNAEGVSLGEASPSQRGSAMARDISLRKCFEFRMQIYLIWCIWQDEKGKF